MKKIFILLILLYGHLYALERESTLKMYHQIFSALVSKPIINVYTDDKEYREVFVYSEKIVLSKKPEESDIVLITNESTLDSALRGNRVSNRTNKKPILFVTNYRFLEKSADIIGAFYWRKGRSQLLFIKNRLDKYGIVLPSEYKDFSVDTL